MNKIITVIALCLVTNTILSQEKVVSWGLSVAPKLSAYFLEDKELSDDVSAWNGACFVDLYYDIREDLQVKTGVGLHRFVMSQIDYSPLFGCDFNPNWGADIYNSYFKTKIIALYASVPIEFKWKIIEKKNHIYLKAGVEGLLKVASKDLVEVYECGMHTFNVLENSIFVPRPFLVLPNAGIGYEFFAWKDKRVFIEPEVEFSIFRFYEKSPIINNGYLLNFGVLAGMKF